VEDYYLGSGEAPGRWIGSRSMRLGLSGVVAADDLRAVLDGRCAASGRSLITVRRPDRLPGLDLTFSAPKSVSLGRRRVHLGCTSFVLRLMTRRMNWHVRLLSSRHQ
jgi:conjugative relaxase-like TrwC/TraI family protein